MSLINVSNLTFGYDGVFDNVFENVSFQIDTDWRLGFVGRNGRGKTTFFKLLMNEFEYSGKISSNVNFEYYPYTVENTDWLTIELVREIASSAMDWEIAKELSLLDLTDDALYRPFCTLSKGEQSKALLAALFLKENAFLLIDEPTNHLDIEAREKLAGYLKKKKGFILISHDRYILDECAEYILAINKCNIEVMKGNFSDWQANKNLRDEYELKENEKLKGEIKRLSASAMQTGGWSDKIEKSKTGTRVAGLRPDRGYIGHKSAKMMKRAKSIEKRQNSAIEEKSKLLKNVESYSELEIRPMKFFDNTLLELSGVSVSYDRKTVCSNINFKIEQGERIALRGKNGSGKSSILKLICGENIDYTGEIRRNNRLIISYVPQSTDGLCGSISDLAYKKGIDESLFRTVLSKLDFSKEQLEKNIEDFSEGQKKKVLLAESLCTPAHLYVWDEPLNYIDVISRIQLENLLKKFSLTIIFVEHDKTFSDSIATKIIEI